jgi:hypothetical protein
MEEARTNVCIRSEEFDNAAWAKTDTTITPDNITSPDGTSNADLLTEGVVGTATVVSTAFTITANGTIVVSCFLKRGNTDWVVVNLNSGANNLYKWFNLATGASGSNAVTGTGVFYSGSGKVQTLPNGWYRCSFAGTVGSGLTTAVLTTNSASADASSIRVNNATRYQFGAMVEDNSTFITSYIKTTSAAVPRNADIATINTLTPWYNALEGTLVARYDVSSDSGTSIFPAAWGFSDGTVANRIAVYSRTVDDTNRGTVIVASVPQADMTVGTITYGTLVNAAMSYKLNDFAYSSGGGAVATDGAGTIPTVTQLDVGNMGGSNPLNGHIRSLAYYPRSLKNQLPQLSA